MECTWIMTSPRRGRGQGDRALDDLGWSVAKPQSVLVELRRAMCQPHITTHVSAPIRDRAARTGIGYRFRAARRAVSAQCPGLRVSPVMRPVASGSKRTRSRRWLSSRNSSLSTGRSPTGLPAGTCWPPSADSRQVELRRASPIQSSRDRESSFPVYLSSASAAIVIGVVVVRRIRRRDTAQHRVPRQFRCGERECGKRQARIVHVAAGGSVKLHAPSLVGCV